MQEQQSQTDSRSYAFYRHITDIPLNKFIEVSTTGNLAALVISGFPPQDELTEAWGIIMEQYSEAIGDHETRLRFNLYKDIHRLELKINQIHLLVSVLKNFYVPQLVTELNSLLVSTIVFDVNKKEEYDRKLQVALNRSKGFKIQLDLKLLHYNAILQEKTEGEPATKEYFQSVLLTLRNFEGYMMRDTDITVFEFCELIKRFNKQMEKRK